MIKSLTSLRGIFILFIFFHHCNIYPGGGTMAVAFFFVLSCFCMTLGYKDRILSPEFNYRNYITRRLIKYFPLHWLTLFAALPFVSLSFNKSTLFTLVVNAVLIQTWIPIKSVFFSFNAVSWYLANTIFFVVVFPFILRFILKISTKCRFMTVGIVIVLYTTLFLLLPHNLYHAILYISPYIRLTDFVLGIFLALGYIRLKESLLGRVNLILWHIIVFSLIMLLVLESCLLSEYLTFVAPVYWFFVSLLILTTSLNPLYGNLLENKYIYRIGELSFTIFLTHKLVLKYTLLLFKILNVENDLLFVCIAFLLTIVISAITDRYILKTTTQWLTKKIQPSMIAQSLNCPK